MNSFVRVGELAAEAVAEHPLPAHFDDLDAGSKRLLRRQAVALGTTPELHYASVLAKHDARARSAAVVDEVLNALKGRR